MGYTPVFSSVFDGTLHGKWPQTGVWLALLAMADRHGCIDRTPQAIASDIGIAVGELIVCIDEFMQPDPMSRTQDCDGRRLVLIDEARPWGWRLVNHGHYREKARKESFDAARVADGRNAERMAQRRTREDPTRPAPTRADPPSDSRLQTPDSDKEGSTKSSSQRGTGEIPRAKRSAEPRGSRITDPFLVTAEMRTWAAERTPHVDLKLATEEFCNYWRAKPGKDGRKLDWILTWKNRMLECESKATRGSAPRKTFDERMAALREDKA